MVDWERKPLEDDELTQLLTAAEEYGDEKDRLIVYTLANTGMRAGELAHMERSWVNFQDSRIEIPEDQPCECGECKRERDGTWQPKTDNGARKIPLLDRDTQGILRAWFELRDEVGMSRKTIWDRVKDIAKETTLTKKVTPHVLRHTYGTILAEQDFTAAEIKAAMGHESLETSERYIQYSGRRLQDAFERKWEGV